MNFLTLLLTIAATTSSAFLMDCNDGTAGDGGCEANGLHTYCVSLLLEIAVLFKNTADSSIDELVHGEWAQLRILQTSRCVGAFEEPSPSEEKPAEGNREQCGHKQRGHTRETK